ncbi:MAG: FHA domain-containing protein [Acidobacteriota bacterium]
MRCSVCGHESPVGSSFCLNCGSALAAAPQTPAIAGGLPAICNVCRGENPPGMKFCRQCGSALGATTPGSPAIGAPMMAPPGPLAMPPPGPMAMPAPMPGPMMPGPMMPGGPVMPSGPTLPAPGALPNPALAPTPLPPPPRGPDASPPRVAQGSTITCPRCGTLTPMTFAYCQQCGLHMQGIVPTDPSQRARQPSRPPPVIVNAAALGVDPMAGTLAQPEGARAAVVGTPAPAPAMRPSATPITGPRPAGAWGSAVLVNRDGSDGQRFSLTSEDTIVGRAGADIAFDEDRFLARQHARIARGSDGNVTVHPIDTVNGVFRKTTEPTELVDGAIILLGREVLRFERVAPEERTAAPLVRHGVALFGSPPREPWGRLLQLLPSGGQRDVRHLAGEEVVLGREEGDIVFRDDAFMSRRHAALTWDGKRALLTDLGSSNGTFVRVTQPTPIKHGDHVRMGDQLLRIEK